MRHIIAILLQNEAGALTRVAGLFSSRGYNIESLSVAPTDDPLVSRLTLVTQGSDAVIQQINSQLLKLVDVVGVKDMTRGEHVERELLLIKLRVAPERRDALNGLVARSAGKVLSVSGDCHIVELTASEAQVAAFISGAASCGEILEVVRSGALGIARGEEKMGSEL
jgi:acetolactate synthase-1/3 small subunit